MVQTLLNNESEITRHDSFCYDNGLHIVGLTTIVNGNHRLGVRMTVAPEVYENPELMGIAMSTLHDELAVEINKFKDALRLVNQPVRHLRARWTMEAQQDLRAMHNLESEAELAQILSREAMQNMVKGMRCVPIELKWQEVGF